MGEKYEVLVTQQPELHFLETEKGLHENEMGSRKWLELAAEVTHSCWIMKFLSR